ncbi:2-phosphoxylose phosphatase 1-like [Argonauta hians]
MCPLLCGGLFLPPGGCCGMRPIHVRRCPVLSCLGLWMLALGAIYFYINQSPQLNQRWPQYSSVPQTHIEVARASGWVAKHGNMFTDNDDEDTGKYLNKLHLTERRSTWQHTKTRNPLTVSRISEYCNSPMFSILGSEGDVPLKYNLEQVHVLIRHGDRTPMHSFRNHPNPSLGCRIDQKLFTNFSPYLEGYLPTMMASQGKQHPASGFKNWALYPNHHICDGSQLTGLGVLQHLQIGEFLKDTYVHRWRLFGNTYNARKVFIRSTEYSRTYQSAIAFLYGFLPHFNLTELLIERSSNLLMCSERHFGSSCHCPVIHALKQSTDRLASFLIQNNSQYYYLAQKIAAVYNLKVQQLPWASAMMDVFMFYACHNMSLPCNSKAQCIDWMVLDNLWEHLDLNGLRQVTSDATNIKRHRLATFPFLYETVQSMKTYIHGSQARKFFLYSGHDVTVTPVLTALGAHSGKWPPYASRIIFELYSLRRKRQKKYYIKILYNGRDITNLTPFCVSATYDNLCPFERFSNFVNKDSLRKFGISDYRDACSQGFQPTD